MWLEYINVIRTTGLSCAIDLDDDVPDDAPADDADALPIDDVNVFAQCN